MNSGIEDIKRIVAEHERRITTLEGKLAIAEARGGAKGSGHKTSSVEEKKPGPLAWLQELVDENFFSEPRSSKDILEELSNRSHRLGPSDLTWPLQELCHEKKLRRGKKTPANGGRKVFHWFNW